MAFVFVLRSKVSNIHVATEDLSSTIMLKRVKTRELEQKGFNFKNITSA